MAALPKTELVQNWIVASIINTAHAFRTYAQGDAEILVHALKWRHGLYLLFIQREVVHRPVVHLVQWQYAGRGGRAVELNQNSNT